MDVERIIDDIEQLQEMFEAPDTRSLSASDLAAANRRHDEMLTHSPVVSAVAEVWHLLPNRVANTPIKRNRQLAPRTVELASSRVFFRSCSPHNVADGNYWRRKCNLCARPKDMLFSRPISSRDPHPKGSDSDKNKGRVEEGSRYP
jgi:hypothetical protein